MASSVAEEIFSSGLIQSDSDFRNFRMYGERLAGIDCAQNTNGYVYHTKYDDYDLITLGSLQHTGDNVVAVIRELEGTDEMRSDEVTKAGSGFIFYDLLGLAFVYYTNRDAVIVNCVVTVALISVICVCIFYITKKESKYDSQSTP